MMDKKRKSTYQFAIIGFVLMNLLLSNFTPIVVSLEENLTQSTLDSSEESTMDSSESLDESMQTSEEEENYEEDSTEKVEEEPPTISTTETSELSSTQEVFTQTTQIASGTIGTSTWQLDDSGEVSVGDGDWTNWTPGATSPWISYASQIKSINFSGQIVAGKYISNLFRDLSECMTISNLGNLNTINTISMSNMFYGARKLSNLSLKDLETENLQSMSSMFRDTGSLVEIDLSMLQLTNVTDMTSMFQDEDKNGSSKLEKVTFGVLNTKSSVKMNSMFRNARKLKKVNLSSSIIGIGKEKKVSVANIHHMFKNNNSLTSVNLSGLDTSKVTDMSELFYGTNSLKKIITSREEIEDIDLEGLNTSNVTDMNGMFYGMSAVRSLDLSNFITNKVTNMNSMFYGMSTLKSLDLSKFDTGEVINMNGMFYGMSAMKTLDLSNFNTSKVTNMNYMFCGMSSLTEINLSSFYIDTMMTMENMFFDTNIQILRLSKQFSFKKTAQLPSIQQTNEYTGYWQNIGSGTVDRPTGTHVLTSDQLMDKYNEEISDTYVWQKPTTSDWINVTFPLKVSYGTSDKKEDGYHITSDDFQITNHSELPVKVSASRWDTDSDSDKKVEEIQSLNIATSQGVSIGLVQDGGDVLSNMSSMLVLSSPNPQEGDWSDEDDIGTFRFTGRLSNLFDATETKKTNGQLTLEFEVLNPGGPDAKPLEE